MVLESDWIWKYSNKITKHVKLSLFQVMQIEYKIQIQFWNLSRHSGWLWSQMRFSNEGNCVAFNRYNVRKKKLFFSYSHPCESRTAIHISWLTAVINYHDTQTCQIFFIECNSFGIVVIRIHIQNIYILCSFFCVLSVKWMKQQAKASKSVK